MKKKFNFPITFIPNRMALLFSSAYTTESKANLENALAFKVLGHRCSCRKHNKGFNQVRPLLGVNNSAVTSLAFTLLIRYYPIWISLFDLWTLFAL